MKRLCLLLTLLWLVGGCAYYQKQSLPQNVYSAADIASQQLTVKQQAHETKYGFRLFTIPIIMPDTIKVTDDLIERNNAMGLTDVEVEFSEFNALTVGTLGNPATFLVSMIFQIPKVKVTGTLVYGPNGKP